MLYLGAWRAWVVNTMPWLLYPWEGDTVPTVQEAGWALRLVWGGVENLAPTRGEPHTIQLVVSC
jgi:hypothetical protein